MSKEEFPSTFDVIVLGTGLCESMVAASLSRLGKSVFHLDRNSHYGGQWATFSFAGLQEYLESFEDDLSDQSNDAGVIPARRRDICNVKINSFIPKTFEVFTENLCDRRNSESAEHASNDMNSTARSAEINESDEKIANSVDKNIDTYDEEILSFTAGEENEINVQGSVEDIEKEFKKFKVSSLECQARIKSGANDISLEDFKTLSRKFNLDISPKFLFSAGPLVKAIIKANISHYAEFKIVDRILMWKDSVIIEVPCNRSDVFSSSFLSMIEKRTLMKFITFCMEEDHEALDFEEESFVEFLKSKHLSENLQKFIIYSIAMVTPNTPTRYAINETRYFLNSLGHYGKSPFIWPLYGVGELPQMFCRMSAVFGGLYCLNKQPSHFSVDKDSASTLEISLDHQKIEASHLIMDSSYLPVEYVSSEARQFVSRAILIVNKSLMESEEEHISFLTIPPLHDKVEPIRVIEVGPASASCPSGLYVLYLSAAAVDCAYDDLNVYVELLTTENGAHQDQPEKPKLYWVAYYNQIVSESFTQELPQHLHVGSPPDVSIGFKNCVEKAKEIFEKICPDEEFMLKVPNNEDIIWEYEEEKKENNAENIEETCSTQQNTDKTETSDDENSDLAVTVESVNETVPGEMEKTVNKNILGNEENKSNSLMKRLEKNDNPKTDPLETAAS